MTILCNSFKYFIILLAYSCVTNDAIAQKTKIKPTDLQRFEIDLNNTASVQKADSSPFHINVLDTRYDTSKIGYLNVGTFKKIHIKDGVENGLTKYLNY